MPLDPGALRSAIYRQYGAYLDTRGVVEDRTAALDRLAEEVASSMIQQRERLLDLSEEILQGVLDEHCPPSESTPRSGTSTRCAPASRSASTSSRRSTRRTRSIASLLSESIWAELEKVIEAREAEFSLPVFLYFARYFYLEEIDARWIDHLKTMEALREGIGLRGYGQKDPKQEYKKEGLRHLRRDDGHHRPQRLREALSHAGQARGPPARQRPTRKRRRGEGGPG